MAGWDQQQWLMGITQDIARKKYYPSAVLLQEVDVVCTGGLSVREFAQVSMVDRSTPGENSRLLLDPRPMATKCCRSTCLCLTTQ